MGPERTLLLSKRVMHRTGIVSLVWTDKQYNEKLFWYFFFALHSKITVIHWRSFTREHHAYY